MNMKMDKSRILIQQTNVAKQHSLFISVSQFKEYGFTWRRLVLHCGLEEHLMQKDIPIDASAR